MGYGLVGDAWCLLRECYKVSHPPFYFIRVSLPLTHIQELVARYYKQIERQTFARFDRKCCRRLPVSLGQLLFFDGNSMKRFRLIFRIFFHFMAGL